MVTPQKVSTVPSGTTEGGSVPEPSASRATAVRKLWAELLKLEAQAAEVRAEITSILGGAPSVAQQMTTVQEAFGRMWRVNYPRGSYVWRHAQDMPNLKRLVNQLGAGELIARVERYMLDTSDYVTRAKHSFPMFVATINSYAQASPDGFALSSPADVEGCTHTPRCKNAAEHTKKYLAEVTRG